MGVPGLQSYVENNCPQAFYNVDIKKLAARHKKYRPKSINQEGKVTMIIDLQSCVRSVYDGLDLLGGGQFKEYSHRWKTFIESLREADICPVFVTDGPVPQSKRQTWIARRYATAKDFVIPVFDALKANKDPNVSSYRSTTIPPLETERILLYDLEDDIELIKSTSEQDADQVIVQLAIERDAFAIFAQDTDYLIYQYPKHVHYLSSQHFNWKAFFHGTKILRTKTYDRNALAKYLGLSIGHLPLLAALKGNDVVSKDSLQRFHGWVKDNSGSNNKNFNHNVIEGLANFIAYEGFPPGKQIFQQLNQLTEFVFYGDMTNQKYVEQALQTYFLMVQNNFKYSNKESQWLALVEMQKPGSKLRNVMEDGRTEQSTRLEDYRGDPSNKLYLPMNAIFLQNFCKRLWGVLLVEKPGALSKCRTSFDLQIEQWHMCGIGSLDKPTYCKPDVPPIGVYDTGLLAQLWTLKAEKDDCDLHNKRWKLFSYIVSPKLSHSSLQDFPPNQIFLISQLFLFQNEDETGGPLLFDWECKVLIILHFLMKKTQGI